MSPFWLRKCFLASNRKKPTRPSTTNERHWAKISAPLGCAGVAAHRNSSGSRAERGAEEAADPVEDRPADQKGQNALGEQLSLDYAQVWPVRIRGGAGAGVRGLWARNGACRGVEGEEMQVLRRDVSRVSDAARGLAAFRAENEVEDPRPFVL